MSALDVRVEAALETFDEDCRWELIGGIVGECPDDVLEMCRRLLCGPMACERTLGADVMGRLVGADQGARPAALSALTAVLSGETDACAVASIVAVMSASWRRSTSSSRWPATPIPAFDSPSPSPWRR
jgi:hypothetical protein